MTRLLAPLLLMLAACSSPDVRVAPAGIVTPSNAPNRVAIAYSSIEVIAVTMPSYATSEEIHAQDAQGALQPIGPLWSDEPARAVTLQIARHLGTITGRLVAPDPWPFRDVPDAQLDVRVEDFYVTAANRFRLAGLYFVAPESGSGNHAHRFEVEVPIGGTGSPADMAAARDRAISQLAQDAAVNGLR